MILWLSSFPCRLPAVMTRRSLMKWSWSALRSSVLVDALFVTAEGETGKTVQGRQTEEHSTTSCNIFPSSLPDSASPSPMPISSTTLVSAGFPAYCPIFKLNDIPLPSAQPRNLKVYSGGKRRWLRCSFECSIYLFLELVFVLHHITSVFSKALIIYWKWEGFFSSHADLLPQWKQICFDSHLTNALIREVSLRSVSECTITLIYGKKHIFIRT